jgi:hypothetical protein
MGAFGYGALDVVDVKAGNEIFNDYDLLQNYPNPFNPSTTLGYSIGNSPLSREPVPIHREVSGGWGVLVQLKIYNILGQEVTTLVNEVQSAGQYKVQWNGKNSAGQKVCSGVYLYRLQAGSFISTKKLLLLK